MPTLSPVSADDLLDATGVDELLGSAINDLLTATKGLRFEHTFIQPGTIHSSQALTSIHAIERMVHDLSKLARERSAQ